MLYINMEYFWQLFGLWHKSQPPPYCAADIWRDLIILFPVHTIESVTEMLSNAAATDDKWCKIVDNKIRNCSRWGDWRSWPFTPATCFAKLVLALRGGAGPEDGLQKLQTALRIHSYLDFQFNP